MRPPRRAVVRPEASLALSLGGCAGSSALRRGQTAESGQDYDRAVVEYTKAVRLVTALGFTLDEPRPRGPKGVLFHDFHMRRQDGH